MSALAEARALAASPRYASALDYQRAHLQVLLAIHDRLDALAAPVVAEEAPGPAPEPAKKRGK
jgi:hypothetical protein